MRSNVAERIYDLKFPSDVGIKAKVRQQKQLLVLQEESELKSTSDFWSDPQKVCGNRAVALTICIHTRSNVSKKT